MKLHLPLGLLSALLVTLASVKTEAQAAKIFSYRFDIPDYLWGEAIKTGDEKYPYKFVADLQRKELAWRGRDWTLFFKASINQENQYLCSNSGGAAADIPSQLDYPFFSFRVEKDLGARIQVRNGINIASAYTDGDDAKYHGTSYYALQSLPTSASQISFRLFRGGALSRMELQFATQDSIAFSDQLDLNSLCVGSMTEKMQFSDFIVIGVAGVKNNNGNVTGFDKSNTYTWTGNGSTVIGANDSDMHEMWQWGASRLVTEFAAETAHMTPTDGKYADDNRYNLQRELFSQQLIDRNNAMRRAHGAAPEDLTPDITNGNFKSMKFVGPGVIYLAADATDVADRDPRMQVVGEGVAIASTQDMGNEFYLGGIEVEEFATGYSLYSGYDVNKDADGKTQAETPYARTLVLGSSDSNNSRTVKFSIREDFHLGTAENRWDAVRLEKGVTAIEVEVAPERTFFLHAKTAKDEPLELVNIRLSGGGTFKVDGDLQMKIPDDKNFLMGVTVDDGSTFDLGGGSNLQKAHILMAEGSLRQADGFKGEIEVDVVHANIHGSMDNLYDAYIMDMGGAGAKNIKTIKNGALSLKNIGDGTLTVTNGEDGEQTIAFQSNHTHFTTGTSGGNYLFHFKNGSEGYVQVQKDTKISLKMDITSMDSYHDNCDSLHTELTPEEGVDPLTYEGPVYFWFTNGTIVDDNGVQLDTTNAAALREWFDKHIMLPAFTYYEDVTPAYDVDHAVDGGKIVLTLSTTGTWISSKHGEVITEVGRLNDSSKWNSVIVDSSLTLNLTPEATANGEAVDGVNKAILRYLFSSGKEGSLSINNKSDNALYVELYNYSGKKHSLSGAEMDADSKFSKDILVNSGKGSTTLMKTGAGTLTLNGNVKGDALLTVTGQLVNGKMVKGKLVLNGEENEVQGIAALEGPDEDGNATAGILELNGKLTVTEDTDLTASDGEEHGELTGRGTLEVKGSFLISADRLGENNTLTVKVEKDGEFGIEQNGESRRLAGLDGGSMDEAGGTLKLGKGDLELVGGDNHVFRGAIENINGGEGAIKVLNGTNQALWSAGNASRDLEVGDGGRLTLVGEKIARGTAMLTADAEYRNITVKGDKAESGKEAGYLRISAASWGLMKDGYEAATTVAVKNLSVEDGGTLELTYNFAGANEDINQVGPIVDASGSISLSKDAHIILSSLGSSFALRDGADIENLVVMQAKEGIIGPANGSKLEAELNGIFLVYYSSDASLSVVDGNKVVLNAKMRNENVYAPAMTDDNARAGAELLWEARYTPAVLAATSQTPFTTEQVVSYIHMTNLMEWTATLAQRGGEERAARILAGVAGSAIPAVGTAQRDALRSQIQRMRDHAAGMGLSAGDTYNELPYYHAWVEATGHFGELSADGMMSGYRLNAWGGSVGMDVDIDNTTSLGIGVSALYGDLSAGSADNVDGKLDSYYLSLMGRIKNERWGHTLVASVGLNQAKIDRRVNYEVGEYKTEGSTNGWGVGLMYEVTYDIALNEEGTSVLQPLVNVSISRTTLKGYSETGDEYLGLEVDTQEWTSASVGIGARYITEIGESVFSRNAQMELRAGVAQDLGDTQGEVGVSLKANPTVQRQVKAAEVGSTAVQVGVGLNLPVDEQNRVYLNAGAELRAHMNTWNATLGYKISF